jgi:hypothetical protein
MSSPIRKCEELTGTSAMLGADGLALPVDATSRSAAATRWVLAIMTASG